MRECLNGHTTQVATSGNGGHDRAFAYVRIGEPDPRGRRMCRSYLVPRERDGEKVDVNRPEDDPFAGRLPVRFEATIAPNGWVRLRRLAGQSPRSPRMWFVVVDDARTRDDMCSIVGFSTDHLDDGTIINHMDFVLMPVANEEQLCAVQWSRRDGTVEQVYVHPDARRSDVGLRIVQTAGAYHQVCGWPGVLHAPGRRTALGQMFTTGGIAPVRFGAHEELSPPMDPSDAG